VRLVLSGFKGMRALVGWIYLLYDELSFVVWVRVSEVAKM
jgi:hypothetical protein